MGRRANQVTSLAVALLSFVVVLLAGTLASLPDPQAHSRSDRFWGLVTPRASSVEEYDSLDAMVMAADAVVVGRIGSVERGREWIAAPDLVDDPFAGERAWARFATATVLIEETIGATTLPLGTTVPLELFLSGPQTLEALKVDLPTERAMFVLRNKGPEDSIEFYRLVNDNIGLLREFDGRVHFQDASESSLIGALEGRPFAEVVSQARSIRPGR